MENTSLNNDSATDFSNINDPQIGQQDPLEIQNISLLEEKLIVKRSKHKVGEVVVRKEVETRMLHIPIRREKLVIEKIGTTTEHLTEVNLGEEKVNGVKFNELGDSKHIYQAQTKFVSLQTAQELLHKISENSSNKNTKIRLEIITDSSESQQAYLDMCD